MTTEQFDQLQIIFDRAKAEAPNDETLGDWLINLGGVLIALGVELTNDESEDEE